MGLFRLIRGVSLAYLLHLDFVYDASPTLCPVPLHTVSELDTAASEAIQRTPNGQVDLAVTQFHDAVQILQGPASTRIRDGD